MNLMATDTQNTAAAWRSENGYTGRAGVVVVYDGTAQGWVNILRNPEHWVPGCFAVNEDGEVWQSIAGNAGRGELK